MRHFIPLAFCAMLACQGTGELTVLDPNGGGSPSSTAGTTAPTATGPPDGSCGEVTQHNLQVFGLITESDGQPVANAEVWLEEMAWAPGILASGTANDQGEFLLEVQDLTSVEDCWGIALDYLIGAEAGDLVGGRGVNSSLYNAILNGSYQADLGDVVIE